MLDPYEPLLSYVLKNKTKQKSTELINTSPFHLLKESGEKKTIQISISNSKGKDIT
jgi:hypothetical protein